MTPSKKGDPLFEMSTPVLRARFLSAALEMALAGRDHTGAIDDYEAKEGLATLADLVHRAAKEADELHEQAQLHQQV